mgnify:CR=1 FL=1
MQDTLEASAPQARALVLAEIDELKVRTAAAGEAASRVAAHPGVRAALLSMSGGDMRGHLLLIDSEGTDAQNAAAPGVDGLQMQLVLQVRPSLVMVLLGRPA